MPRDAKATIHFMDGSKLVVSYRRMSGKSLALAERIRKAVAAELLLVEVKGNLLVIPMQNVKYVEVAPAPDVLPAEVVSDAVLVPSN